MKLLGSIFTIALMVSFLATPFATGGSSGAIQLSIVNSDVNQLSTDNPDFNNDMKVDETDLELMLNNWGECDLSKRCFDLTGDKMVNSKDLTILLAGWTKESSDFEFKGPGKRVVPIKLFPFSADKPNMKDKAKSGLEIGSFGVKGSITTTDVAEITGIEEDVIESDIVDFNPDSSDSVSFPGKIIVFKAIADDDSINLVRGYIGSQRTAKIVNGEVEPGEVIYRGRVVLEIEGQKQVESYLIVDGNEVDYIYGLVPIIDGKIVGDKPTSKLLFNPRKNEAMFSFGDKRGIVELKIISLERSVIRPQRQSPPSIVPDLGITDSQERRPLPFWRRWFFVPTPKPGPEINAPEVIPSEDVPDISDENSGRSGPGFFNWFLGFFRSNSVDDLRFKNIEEKIEISSDDNRLTGERRVKADVFEDRSSVTLIYKFELKSDESLSNPKEIAKRIIDKFALSETEAKNLLKVVYHNDPESLIVKSDLNKDGKADNDDLELLINEWGPCSTIVTATTSNCIADLDGDDEVSTSDMLILLGDWTKNPQKPFNPDFKDKGKVNLDIRVREKKILVEIKMRFSSGADIDTIIKDIVDKTQLSEDFVISNIKLDRPNPKIIINQHLDRMEKMEIEVEIDFEDGISFIEIESKSFEKEFSLQTTDRDMILSEIAKILDTSVENIRSFVKFKS